MIYADQEIQGFVYQGDLLVPGGREQALLVPREDWLTSGGREHVHLALLVGLLAPGGCQQVLLVVQNDLLASVGSE